MRGWIIWGMETGPNEYNLLMIERQLVESMNIESPLQALKLMAVDAASAREFANRLGISFEGYEDAGEVYLDPRVQEYMRALTNRFPYWLHFACKDDDTLFVVFNCLAPPEMLDGGASGKVRLTIDGKAWNKILGELFEGMNELHDRLGLTAAENTVITRLVGAWTQRTLGERGRS